MRIRWLRRGLAAALVGGGCLGLLATPAAGASPAFLTVTPDRVAAGTTLHITGGCGGSVSTATISSSVFASPIRVTPKLGLFFTDPMVLLTAPTGTFTVTLRCANGNVASTTLWVTAFGLPSGSPTPAEAIPTLGPATGAGGMAGGGAGLVAGGAAAVLAGLGLGGYALRRRHAYRR